jgi:hypothetical protein
MKKMFFDRLGKYVRIRLQLGVPSLFSDLTTIYRLAGLGDAFAQEQVKFLEEIMTSYKTSLAESKTFPGEEKKQAATTWLWSSYFLAQVVCLNATNFLRRRVNPLLLLLNFLRNSRLFLHLCPDSIMIAWAT